VAVGVSAVIAASTLVSQWLRRHAVTWPSTVVQFLVMGAVNTGLALATGRILPSTGTLTPAGTFLFLVGLLTLIVVLFDRFKLIGRRRARRSRRAAVRALPPQVGTRA